jgi:hypothetical protein
MTRAWCRRSGWAANSNALARAVAAAAAQTRERTIEVTTGQTAADCWRSNGGDCECEEVDGERRVLVAEVAEVAVAAADTVAATMAMQSSWAAVAARANCESAIASATKDPAHCDLDSCRAWAAVECRRLRNRPHRRSGAVGEIERTAGNSSRQIRHRQALNCC